MLRSGQLPLRALTALLLIVLAIQPAVTDADVRFYRITKKNQEKLLMTVRNRDKPGCQNQAWSKRLYRVVVYDFEQCHVYHQKDCPAGEEIEFIWAGRRVLDAMEGKETTTTLLPGSKWIVAEKANVKFASWHCQ